MNYSIIITTLGCEVALDRTLTCARASSMLPREILVGDAAPKNYVSDQCRAICEDHAAQYYYVGMTGFANNVNGLIKRCDPVSDFILLLGQDVWLLPDTVEMLWEENHRRTNCITQAQLIDPVPVRRPRLKLNDYTTCMWGNCTLIPRQFQREHNIWFDERLWSYVEDTQFGFDWLNAGGKIYQTDAMAIHSPTGYFATHPEGLKYYYLARNSIHIARRYKGWLVSGLMIAAGLMVLKPRLSVYAGVLDGLRGIYGPHKKHINQ